MGTSETHYKAFGLFKDPQTQHWHVAFGFKMPSGHFWQQKGIEMDDDELRAWHGALQARKSELETHVPAEVRLPQLSESVVVSWEGFLLVCRRVVPIHAVPERHHRLV